MDEPTTAELKQALAAFFMCFGAGLPAQLKESIRQRAYDLATQIEHGGEPNVARLTKALADSLVAAPRPPSH